MAKRFISALLVWCTMVYGAPVMVNGIAFFVNGEPITLFELYEVMQVAKVSQEKAIDLLISKRLHEEEIQKRQITISDLEIDQELQKQAQRNRTTLEHLKELLQKQGGNWERYRDEVGQNLQKQKLYQAITSDNLKMSDEASLRSYYQNHQEEFSIPQSLEVVKFYSSNKAALEKMIKEAMTKKGEVSKRAKSNTLIKQENEILQTAALNPQILPAFMQTKINEFTPIFPIDSQFVTFLIIAKNNIMQAPYDEVKNIIAQKVITQKQDYIIYEYFEKLRSNAKVTIVRLN